MKIIFKRSAEKEILSYDKTLARRVFTKIGLLSKNPQPHGSKKLDTDYRIRIGKYRVIYTIDKAGKLITITKVGHRREVYRWSSRDLTVGVSTPRAS